MPQDWEKAVTEQINRGLYQEALMRLQTQKPQSEHSPLYRLFDAIIHLHLYQHDKKRLEANLAVLHQLSKETQTQHKI